MQVMKKPNTKTLYVVQSGFTLLRSFFVHQEADSYAQGLDPVMYGNSPQHAYVEEYAPGELDYDDVESGYFE